MAGQDEPPGFSEFDERLRALRRESEPAVARPSGKTTASGARLGVGLQAGVEVIAGVAGGALIGYALDRWLGTAPLFLIIMFFLGAAAGVLNAYRTLRRFGGVVG